MQAMMFNEYGLVVLNTKSKEGSTDLFEVQAFIKFSKASWPKKPTEHAGKKGGKRTPDLFRAFFVVGGPKELAPPVPTSEEERTGEAITWDIWSSSMKEGMKCSSLVNWPNCDHDPSAGQTSLDRFLVKENRPVVVSVPSENSVREGQTVFVLVRLDPKNPRSDSEHFSKSFSYVQFDANKNKIYSHETLRVDREKQEWLASRAKDIVVLMSSAETSENMPLQRLRVLFSSYPHPVTAHALPPELNGFEPGKSISRCSTTEHIFAVTQQTAGYDNDCGEDADYLQRLAIAEDCSIDPSSDAPTGDEHVAAPMQVDDRYEPYHSIMMEVEDDHMISHPRHVGHAPIHHCLSTTMVDKQDRTLLTANMIFEATNQIQNSLSTVDTRVRKMQSTMDEQEELRKASEEFSSIELQRKFGLDRDPEIAGKLSKIVIGGTGFTKNQVHILSLYPWLDVHVDEGAPLNSFFRCKLCNRGLPLPGEGEQFRKCSRVDSHQGPEKATNYLGVGKVMCVKKFLSSTMAPHESIRRAVRRHELSKEHNEAMKLYHEARGANQREVQNLAIDATITATLGAYTIAKQGLPLSSQFPLMMLALRTGARVGTAHYEATTAKRMINNFAVHIEYDLLKYIMKEDLPFSILMDGSSSARGTKWVSFMIRTITPSFRPITFHLLLAEMGRETGETITNAFISYLKARSKWVQSPGLPLSPHAYAMRRLISITTDGASTMTGTGDGVFGRLRRHILEQTSSSPVPRTDLLLSVCAAHKLNLAMKKVQHPGYTLARALIMEMHSIFGVTQASSARRHYIESARLMGFSALQMGQFFAIRWSDSFRKGLSCVVRMWPVLIESLEKVQADAAVSEGLRTRARLASWVMRDGRVFLAMKLVTLALDKIATFSLRLQDTESLSVDDMEDGRAVAHSLLDGSLFKELYKELTQKKSPLQGFDGERTRILDDYFLDHYYTVPSGVAGSSTESKQWQLVYISTNFKDFKKRLVDQLSTEEKMLSRTLTSFKFFRPLSQHANEMEQLQQVIDFNSPNLQYRSDSSPDLDPDVPLGFTLASSHLCYYSKDGDELQEHAVEGYDKLKSQVESLSLWWKSGHVLRFYPCDKGSSSSWSR
ncbi:hypothetical protein Aduo_007975 [Ancylostoma duodenale]